MKNFLIILFISTLFIGCDNKSFNIVNNPDYEVTLIINCNARCEHIINPHTSISITEEPIIRSYTAIPPRVSHTGNNETLTFFNTPAKQLTIVNGINKNIFVTAQGCIDNEPISVLANGDFTGNIYSNNPIFNGTTFDGYPVQFTLSIDNQSVFVHW